MANLRSQYATQVYRVPSPLIGVTPCNSKLSAMITELSGASIATQYLGKVKYAPVYSPSRK